MPQYKNIWSEVQSQLFEKLTAESIKGKYVHGTLKMWKESIKTNFHGEDVLYDMYFNATAVLKIYSVYIKVKIIILRYECKYTDAENRQCNVLSDDDNGFFAVQTGGK